MKTRKQPDNKTQGKNKNNTKQKKYKMQNNQRTLMHTKLTANLKTIPKSQKQYHLVLFGIILGQFLNKKTPVGIIPFLNNNFSKAKRVCSRAIPCAAYILQSIIHEIIEC